MTKSKYPPHTAEARRRASNAWKRKNKAKTKANLKRWLSENKERRQKWAKDRYEKRKSEFSAKDAARYLRPENVAKRAAKKKAKKAYMRQWHLKNPARKRCAMNKRRAQKLNTRTGPLRAIIAWEKRWKAQFRVRCYWCLGEFDPNGCHTDHVVPLKRGGAHALENLCISCAPCNLSKNRKSLEAWNQQIEQPVLF